MRYIKLLFFAVFFFLAMVFFFQNQGPLSQQMELTLNLFFIPPVTSIPLPFYFIVIAAFFIGCLLSMCFLWWDKMNASARLVKTRWRVNALENEVSKLKKQMNPEPQQENHSIFHRKNKALPEAPKAAEPEKAEKKAE